MALARSMQPVTHCYHRAPEAHLSAQGCREALPPRPRVATTVNTLATILSRPGVRLEDAPASFFAGTALGGTGRFGSYAAPQVGPDPSH